MNFQTLQGRPVAVIGAGTMGAGIAQIAALAGHPVRLHDQREGAAAAAVSALAIVLDGLVERGKLKAEAAAAALARIQPAASIGDCAGCALVVEAIVENLAVKRELFAQLEGIVADDAILATNTSSLSVTAIGRDLRRPERLVGMHFFNPVPLMKLVEVVSGLRTDRGVAEAIAALATAWGKVAVHARSTPGFIVNRIARPFYAETLALLGEVAGTPDQIDDALRGAGFRMGPCELMDLIGHDVNLAVTESVHAATYGDKRFVPSLVQRELVDGGMLGRKSGRGFYAYPRATAAAAPGAHADASHAALPASVALHCSGPIADRIATALVAYGVDVRRAPSAEAAGGASGTDAAAIELRFEAGGRPGRLQLTDGRTAQQVAAATGLRDVAVFDWPLASPAAAGNVPALAWAAAGTASDAFAAAAAALLVGAGFRPVRLHDPAGLAVARTVAMLVNEAADAVQQGVCEPAEADTAMTLGVNYPAGPFQWLDRVGVERVVALLDHLDAGCRGERYRVSPWLMRRLWAQRLG